MNNGKKIRNILFWIAAVLFLVYYFQYGFQALSKNGKYVIAKTTRSTYYKAIRRGVDYEFTINDKMYGGQHTEIKGFETDIVIPGYYLAIYSTKNPEISVLLIEKTVSQEFNIDSLNAIGLDKSDIKWWNL